MIEKFFAGCILLPDPEFAYLRAGSAAEKNFHGQLKIPKLKKDQKNASTGKKL
ncbi:MAG: hypothetical protein IKD23_02565 [Lentisphaeria bacterium]|nr:hypothetical protein [Lentisphaeria bacterium]